MRISDWSSECALPIFRFAASTDEIGAKVISLRAAIQRADAELEGRALVFSKDVMAYPDIVGSQRDLFERRRQLQAQELSGLEESMKLAKQQQDLVEELTKTGDASLSAVLKTRGQVNDIQSTIVNKRNAYRQEAQAELPKTRGDHQQKTEK